MSLKTSRYLFGLLFLGVLTTACTMLEGESPLEQVVIEPTPLIDSLLATYDQIKAAASEPDAETILKLLHSSEIARIQERVRFYGKKSTDSYLAARVRSWPALYGLALTEIRNYNNLIRLTLEQPDSPAKKEEPRSYLFLLFGQSRDGWRLLAHANFEKDRVDHYGHQITYHETDLPPRLRFPGKF